MRLLKGEDYFEVRKRLLVVKKKLERGACFFLNLHNYFEMKEKKVKRIIFEKYNYL